MMVMSDKPSREECARACDSARSGQPRAGEWNAHGLQHAADYLRQDADLAERLAAERDALAEQVASCRKALEWLRETGLFWFVDEHGLLDVARGKVQPKDEWMTDLSNATGVPLAHLTGETEEAGE